MAMANNYHMGKARRRQIFAATSLFALVTGTAARAQITPAFGQPVAPAQADNTAQTDKTAQPTSKTIQPSSVIQEITITGTQIRGVAPVGAPVITVGRQEIEDSGLTTTADILHDIPEVTLLGAGQSTLGANQNANLNTNRDNAINIRGLGPQATLTLLDGRRTPLGGSSGNLYDPSSIPTIAISNIDVVADGASATYGSDAVAGVANIVLRTHFQGFEVEGDYGSASDYDTRKISGIYGHSWGNGSVMIAAETNFSSSLMGSKRIGLFNCNETALGATLGCSAFSPSGNIVVPAGASIPKGTYGIPASSTGTGITASQLGPESFFNPAQDLSVLPKTNRNSVVGHVQQDVNKQIRLWAEGYYTQNNTSYINSQLQASGTVTPANPGFIPLGPGITSETADLGLDSIAGLGARAGFERAYQAAAGVDIQLPRQWALDAYYEHNYNYEYTDTVGLNSNAERTAFACITPGLCFDPFGPAPGNQAAIASFIGYQHFNYYQTEDLVNAKIDGSIFTLPGGDIKLAVGTEIHHDSLNVLSQNDEAAASTATVTTAANFTTDRTVASVFAEAIIPVIGSNNAIPLVDKFDIDLAGRYDHYSDVGGTANPKISARWKPSPDVSLHADFGTSFRAPTLCDTNPGCSAADLPTTTLYGPGVNAISILGGNASLKPETATTYSIGADYRPSWLRGFNATINYYNIDYKNVIGTPGQSGPSVLTNPVYNSLVIRNPTQAQINYYASQPFFTSVPFALQQGVVNDIILGTRQNAGAIKTDGIDFTADYDWANSLGRWSAGINGTYTLSYNYSVLSGLGFVQSVNEANYPVSFKARARFSWTLDNLTAVTYVNYTGAYRVVGLAYATQDTPVDAYTTVDATLLYRLDRTNFLGGYANNLTLAVSVQNLFNSGPPFALITNDQDFDSQQASALGREVTFTIKKAF